MQPSRFWLFFANSLCVCKAPRRWCGIARVVFFLPSIVGSWKLALEVSASAGLHCSPSSEAESSAEGSLWQIGPCQEGIVENLRAFRSQHKMKKASKKREEFRRLGAHFEDEHLLPNLPAS